MPKIAKQNRIKEIDNKIAEYIFDYVEDMSDEELIIITAVVHTTSRLLKEVCVPEKESLH